MNKNKGPNMKTITRLMTTIVLPLGLLMSAASYAARLQKVDAVNQGNTSTQLRLFFDSAVGTPVSFAMPQSGMVVLDFADSDSVPGMRKKLIQSPYVKSIRTAKGNGKLRVMISLAQQAQYQAQVQGSQVTVTFSGRAGAPVEQVRPAVRAAQLDRQASAAQNWAVARQAQASHYRQRTTAQAPAQPAHQAAPVMIRQLAPIDFRRTNNGGGKAIITLPHPATEVSAVKVGNSMVLKIRDTSTKEPKKRLNVMDFATPVAYVDVERKGADALVRLVANTAFEHQVSRQGNQYVVTMNKVKRRVKPVDPFKPKPKKYTGKPLSLNFQDIEVRSVLQLLADFTDKNIVVSDSVKGNITLRLKSVPWDQALDIVLESKALAMRSNGNVIWVAPAVELQAKEQQELRAREQQKALEPLVTEYISVNFAKADEMLTLIKSQSNGKSSTILSDRGSVSVDKRTNTLLVQDTVSRVDQVRNMIKSLDVPVRQVSVEARIVIASDNFGKELGARFGVTKIGNSGGITSGSLGSTSSIANDIGSGSTVSVPGLSDRLNMNLPVIGAAGSLGFSLLAKDYLLDLELSALQAESKGDVISTPRIVTADKKKAVIEQGVDIPFQQASSSGATSVSFKKAVLSLEVTPQVTPDEHVIMDLKVNQDTVGAIYSGVPSINTREIVTQVLVDNGQTVVLGGVHEETNQRDTTKIPVLSELPYLGKLFQKNVKSNDKRELLIFVTPKILN
ncbi:MAG: pilus assembly protein PilQ [Proteobacteria bacterium]|nr:MAG: pilus assembly protein PilQ [Pseudomonadota bacterium]